MKVNELEISKDQIVEWIRKFFDQNGNGCNAVVGISGGIDSSVVAALCVEALGKDRVIGVLLPQNTQTDIDAAYELCNHLGIKKYEINVGGIVDSLLTLMSYEMDVDITQQTQINLPPRIRMATLYAVSQSINGRVANTCNLSEDWVGWNTRYGDSVGDFAPLAFFTKTEVKQLARELNLPDVLVEKTPIDGLCGSTDEEAFGFSYETLDHYIRTGEINNMEAKEKIDSMHRKNLFKLRLMPSFTLE